MNGMVPSGAVPRTNAFYGQGTGSIHLDQVGCLGTEATLTDCPANALGVHDCTHSEDAGVTCAPVVTTAPPRTSAIQLEPVYLYSLYLY